MYILSHNIVSPIGMTTEDNLQAVLHDSTALCRYEGKWGLPDPFTASLFSDEQMDRMMRQGLSRFESLVVESVERSLQNVKFDYSADDVIFILSTTKANVELQNGNNEQEHLLYPAVSAQRIARYIGFITQPVVVCNACISGLAALRLAACLLNTSQYRYAVVCGADVQSAFIVSGFMSLKALSADQCRPFDIERLGLNLGEAAATMVLASDPEVTMPTERYWQISRVAVRNDAFHLSSPSKTADGAFLALNDVLDGFDTGNLAFINLHGTATMFNDQMEAVALRRAGLSNLPTNGLKGYYGHTMGAAGILETILSLAAADEGIILGTRGFEELGVSAQLNLSPCHRTTSKTAFVKMISGFGGGNAALLAVEGSDAGSAPTGIEGSISENVRINLTQELKQNQIKPSADFSISHSVSITPDSLTIDGKPYSLPENHSGSFLTALYKRFINDFPKFYKMDILAKLGFIASELILQAEGGERFKPRTDRAIILFNRTASISADREYQKTISDPDSFFPSPSLFIYTLPNIVTGEIAIRNHYQGETEFYVLPEYNQQIINQIVSATFSTTNHTSVLFGWLDADSDTDFRAELFLADHCLNSKSSMLVNSHF